MKTINCEICKKFEYVYSEGKKGMIGGCALGYKLRFFKPKHERDDEWGYRKKCLRYDEDVNK